MGIPLVHTCHSLGRAKRERLLAKGRKPQAVERQFNFSRRIGIEERVMRHASLVVASTQQEVDEQHGMYESHQARKSIVIPPGVDVSRFSPPGRRKIRDETEHMVDRFLSRPDKPLLLTIGRPEESKNLNGLMRAYGSDLVLQDMANLLIVAGNRDDVDEMDATQQKTVRDLLLDVDRYDVWGKVALPKRHAADDIPDLYRLAARRRGVYANPALIELFGLALIEAAASGLPVVATQNGGPKDIVERCHNGLLVDPTDPAALSAAVRQALRDRQQWRKWSQSGIRGVRRHYSWDAHVTRCLKNVRVILHRERKRLRRRMAVPAPRALTPLPFLQRLLITDIDDTLTGDREALAQLTAKLREMDDLVGFGVATGRTLESACRELSAWGVAIPDVLVTAVGTEIHYGRDLTADSGWATHIAHLWRRDALVEAFSGVPGLTLQQAKNQREFKLSYYITDDSLPSVTSMYSLLRQHRLHGRIVVSKRETLDVLPVRASKGHAIRYLAYRRNLPLSGFLIAGDSGNDKEMLKGDTLGVVVGNHSRELASLRGLENVYFAQGKHATGILEGIDHYRFDEASGLRPALAPRPRGAG